MEKKLFYSELFQAGRILYGRIWINPKDKCISNKTVLTEPFRTKNKFEKNIFEIYIDVNLFKNKRKIGITLKEEESFLFTSKSFEESRNLVYKLNIITCETFGVRGWFWYKFPSKGLATKFQKFIKKYSFDSNNEFEEDELSSIYSICFTDMYIPYNQLFTRNYELVLPKSVQEVLKIDKQTPYKEILRLLIDKLYLIEKKWLWDIHLTFPKDKSVNTYIYSNIEAILMFHNLMTFEEKTGIVLEKKINNVLAK